LKSWFRRPESKRAALALLLLVPAPSIGAAFSLIIAPDSVPGLTAFLTSKFWMLLLPLFWQVRVDHEPLSASPPRHGGWLAATLSGILISIAIVAVYLFFGDQLIDRPYLVRELASAGLASPAVFAGATAYWILVNSLLEEYVWRWFCVKQCARLFRPVIAAVASAAFFTLHHIVAMQVYLPVQGVAVCAAGVFAGGLIWSAMYMKYGSIWPGYLSHAIVDLTVFAIGADLLFGNTVCAGAASAFGLMCIPA